MEIKNENKIAMLMDKEEFSWLKQTIIDNNTITKDFEKELDDSFYALGIENKLWQMVEDYVYEDACWSELASEPSGAGNVFKCFSAKHSQLYEKVRNMYRTSIKMSEFFTDEQLDEIKFRYGLMITFEQAFNYLFLAGQTFSDIEYALDYKSECDWVFREVDKVEGKANE